MTRQVALGLLAGAVVLAMGVAEAQAFGWRHHHGSYGSWGGSYGAMYGYGSYGGHVYVFQRRGWGSYGSGGSWGSYGSYGSYGSGGSWGGYSYGSCGSSGGSYGGSYGSWGSVGGATLEPGATLPHAQPQAQPQPGAATNPMPTDSSTPLLPPQPMNPTPMPGPLDPTNPPPLPMDPGAARASSSGLIAVEVPADAKVFINGAATRSTGTHREYISRNLQPGLDYTYEIRVEWTKAGVPARETRTVTLRAGGATELAFGGASEPAVKVAAAGVETTLTLHVPADAKVNLAGNDVVTPGETRVYKTTALGEGQVWNDYQVTVRIERDGKEIVRTQTIRLAAGDDHSLSFDFSDEKLAGKSADVR